MGDNKETTKKVRITKSKRISDPRDFEKRDRNWTSQSVCDVQFRGQKSLNGGSCDVQFRVVLKNRTERAALIEAEISKGLDGG